MIVATQKATLRRGIGLGLWAGYVVVAILVVYFFIMSPILGVWIFIALTMPAGMALLWKMPSASNADTKTGLLLLFLFVFFAIVWPRYALLRVPGLPGLSPARSFQALLLVYWFYAIAKNIQCRERFIARVRDNRPLFIAIFWLLAFKFLSIFASDIPFVSLKGFFNELFSVYLPFFIAISFVRNSRDAVVVCCAVLFGAITVAGFGVLESVINRNIFIGIFDVDSDYIRQVLLEKIRAGSYRLQSTFSHPLTFSEFIVVTLPVALALIGRYFSVRIVSLIFALVFVVLAGFVVVKSGSRSGVGVLLIAVGFYVVMLSVRQLKITTSHATSVINIFILLVVAASLVIGVFVISDFLVGKTTRELNSALVRLEMWSHGLSMALSQPFFGYGQDMAAVTLGFVEGDGNITIDSYYLSVLLESGFVSLFLYIFVILYIVIKGIRRGLVDFENGPLIVAIAVSGLCFSIVKSVLSLTHNHGVFMVVFSLIIVLTASKSNNIKNPVEL